MAGSYIFGVVFGKIFFLIALFFYSIVFLNLGSLSVLYFIIYAVVTFKYVRIGILIVCYVVDFFSILCNSFLSSSHGWVQFNWSVLVF
jgi:hypothetical protein